MDDDDALRRDDKVLTAAESAVHLSRVHMPPVMREILKRSRLNLLTSISRKQFSQCAERVISHFPKDKEILYKKCHQMSFQKSGLVVALASSPGSGNSWVRQLLESATGIYTGAVYCDAAYVYTGMIGEGLRTGNVLAVKTHCRSSDVLRNLKPNKVIYIVRNPFECILADWCRVLHNSGKHAHTVECVQTNGNEI